MRGGSLKKSRTGNCDHPQGNPSLERRDGDRKKLLINFPSSLKEWNEGGSMFLNNRKALKVKRKSLRHSVTPQEVVLWSRLRMNQLGSKFRRQHSIGRYIIDFYCPEKKLVIEIDGSQHLDKEKYDKERTDYLYKLGITVLRFWDNEVNTNIEGVIMKIMTTLNPSFERREGEVMVLSDRVISKVF